MMNMTQAFINEMLISGTLKWGTCVTLLLTVDNILMFFIKGFIRAAYKRYTTCNMALTLARSNQITYTFVQVSVSFFAK